jgi:beta-lactamase superfamily II metal-dependent hydrolase
MAIVKSYSVGNGDMFSIRHNSDNFTQIDCCLCAGAADDHIADLKEQSKGKGISRFISTHPDQDHLQGIELLDAEMPIHNFYVVKNQATKSDETESFKHYCKLRDDSAKAFHISKGVTRRWMNLSDAERGSAGVQILWPDTSNPHFKEALAEGDASESYNNMSAVIRYALEGGASFMWLGLQPGAVGGGIPRSSSRG